MRFIKDWKHMRALTSLIKNLLTAENAESAEKNVPFVS